MPRSAKVVAFSTSPEMAAQIDRLATDEDRTRSELLREAFRFYARREVGFVANEAPVAYSANGATTIELSRAGQPPSGPLVGFELVRAARLSMKRLCRSRGVRRLWVFGSAVRPDFDPVASDVDFLVEWLPDAPRGPWLSHLTGLEAELSEALGRPVDVVEADAVSNSRVVEAIASERVLVYEST